MLAGLFPWGRNAAAMARPIDAQRVMPVDIKLPDLPYAFDALEPVIDAKTMEIHHGRHHGAYVNNTINALEKHPDLKALSLPNLLGGIPSLPADIRQVMRDSGGGHWNHALFWDIMTPEGGETPVGDLAAAIDSQFGSFEAFKDQFNRAGATRFGSGWAWLSVRDNGDLFVSSTPNQDNPLMTGLVEQTGVPILGLDVWEHAYYLHYQWRRADYIQAWWSVVDWEKVESLYQRALGRLA